MALTKSPVLPPVRSPQVGAKSKLAPKKRIIPPEPVHRQVGRAAQLQPRPLRPPPPRQKLAEATKTTSPRSPVVRPAKLAPVRKRRVKKKAAISTSGAAIAHQSSTSPPMTKTKTLSPEIKKQGAASKMAPATNVAVASAALFPTATLNVTRPSASIEFETGSPSVREAKTREPALDEKTLARRMRARDRDITGQITTMTRFQGRAYRLKSSHKTWPEAINGCAGGVDQLK